jgi:uncharacterized membrane protein HdeD (DUF308 family)
MAVAAQQSRKDNIPWWAYLLQGLVLILVGVLFLTNTAATALIFIQVLGIYWLIQGVIHIVMMFVDHTWWGLKLASGLLGILAGLAIINHPLYSPFLIGSVLIIFLGVQGLIGGILGIIQAFKGSGWGAAIIGALSVIFGLWLLANIGAATLALPWVMGLLGVVGGIATVVLAFRMK